MAPNEPIAVIGSGCRFPGGVTNPSELWELLKKPRDVQKKIPKDRFDVDTFYHPDGSHHGRTNAPYAYLLEKDVKAFDAPFFNIQAAEAEAVDPAHRLLLETLYDSVSAAGLRIQDLQGSSTAVYVGMMTHDYDMLVTSDLDNIPMYAGTGVAQSIASNRLSYFFGWRGPSMTIDTACSSSLVAVHLAVQQLRSGESKMAVAAGANMILSPMSFVLESKLNMLSPTGRSRMWDSAADGYARGEGVCALVLKTLSQALQDGDHIECIIRETGVNQDGKTTGITMPSHIAQAELIRETYAKAGLDITKAEERPQFFEAHGTGTQAGDPQEANAIAEAFFGHKEHTEPDDDEQNQTLFVGSIKTVIGHTEGSAGIAGLMKASAAVQHGVIPPNMLFENLSPRVAPFYEQGLCIVKEATPWPAVAPGQPRRASVNSFGFGGTNAHAVVEEYQPGQKSLHTNNNHRTANCVLPLVISAKSERSLKSALENMLRFVETEPAFEMQDLAWTLLRKQSVLPYRCALPARTKEAAALSLKGAIEETKFMTDFSTEAKGKSRLLAIFTGQGAQWPGMLEALVSTVPYARDVVVELDNSLKSLPIEYRPSWTLLEQLMLKGDASNVANASFSQPLCCALQIVLVRLLFAAGFEFRAILTKEGSGEIACAFAAGLISASQAIRIAYLRGLVSKYASSPSGQPGAMLAAGMSYEDAQELCELEVLKGRVCVAASNSPESVTISGDADAIQDVQGILEDESRFARLLKVDKAYHSHHMLPCSPSYIGALKACGCAVADGETESTVAWYSSVYDNKRMKSVDVNLEYWRDNLVSPVLFSQAVALAGFDNRPLDAVIEIGPHPALKGPCIATLKDCGFPELPYTGCLQRGSNDVDAFASALGYIWEHFGLGSIDSDSLISQTSPGHSARSLASVLPQYPWDHSRTYWTESRLTRHLLHGKLPHLLLGRISPLSSPTTFKWHNFIRPRDIDWLDGHGLQGQTVFPAAGYIVMALEAAMQVASERQVQLLEIIDMDINKAVTFEDENSLIELNLTANMTHDATNSQRATLDFVIDSCLTKENELSTSARGQLVITFGPVSSHILPPAEEEHPDMRRVNMDNFYRELDAKGYNYSKDFRRVLEMKRADGKSTGTLAYPMLKDGQHQFLIHPAALDLSLQTVIGAYSSPGDNRLRSLYVPTHIDRLALVPSVCWSVPESSDRVQFNAVNTYDKGDYLAGDIQLFVGTDRESLLQIENMVFKPFSPLSRSNDHRIFSKWVWGPLTPEKLLDDPALWATDRDKAITPMIERIVYFYSKLLLGELTDDERLNAAFHHKKQISWAEHVLAEARQGQHQWYQPSWEVDSHEQIQQLCESNSWHRHVRMVQRVGENMLSMIRDNQNPFELMDHDGLLTECYADRLTFGPALNYSQELVNQIAHRFQSMDILEIGAGTGGTTKYILRTPQLGFNSYTFTDISTAFFETASEEFAEYEDRMEFRPLDIRRSPTEQGFEPHSYDLVIASNVLHATPKLEETMANVRMLLKPGGHAVILEITNREHSRLGFIFGFFPDWWAGHDEGRVLEPFISLEQWDDVLKRVGFSGIESRSLDRDIKLWPTSAFSAQAASPATLTLSKPLSAPPKESYPPLVVVGGDSSKTSGIFAGFQSALPHRQLQHVRRLQDVHESAFQTKSTFVVLSDLDDELFANLDEDRFETVKSILFYAGHLLWVTENAWVDHPRQAMTIGMLRSVGREQTDMHLQILDVDKTENLDPTFLAEQVLRLEDASAALDAGILWTEETEVYISQGRALVPRLKQDIARNNRLNSSHRPILDAFNPEVTPVALRQTNREAYLESAVTYPPLGYSDASISVIQVRYALAKAIRFSNLGYFHLVQGVVSGESTPVIALASSNASIVHVPTTHVFRLPNSHGLDACLLLPIAASLVAQSLLSNAVPGTSILVLEPPEFCVEALARAARSRHVRANFATVRPISSKLADVPWLQLHGKETDRQLKVLLPTSLSTFCNLSTEQTTIDLSRRIASHLPSTCARYTVEDLLQDNSVPTFHEESYELVQLPLIEQAVMAARNIDIATSPSIVHASQLQVSADPFELSTVIDWKTSGAISARARPVDSEKLFAGDKTYLLVGLTGDLGRSLCRWMVTKGARYVVLTSRNPKVDPRWLDEIKRLGGEVMVLPMDVANEKSVDDGLVKVREGFPRVPIGGIAFGPLVLQDVLLKDMDFQMMQMVLKPKAEGARILHERFSSHAELLDFFVMFSSIVTVLGNPGQANYGAANAYLQALAQQRRSTGLVGSTIDIGAVYGVGYVTRAEMEENFNAVRFMFQPVEEHELHTLFAEAVVSGRRITGKNFMDMSDIEITTGIPELDPVNKDRIVFYDDARVGNFKIPEQRGKVTGTSGSKASVVKEQLLQATTLAEVRQIVIEGLSEKLRSTLQIPAEESVHPTTPLIDQGVDSLGAVTIGTWFSKQLTLDLPLLKVLGGASVTDLADEAVERLAPNAIPLVEREAIDSANDSSTPESSDEAVKLDSESTTPPTDLSSVDEELTSNEPKVVRQESLSLGQQYSWKLQHQAGIDPTIFNTTIGMFLEGPLDLGRLSRALHTLLRRHEAFRTKIVEIEDDLPKPVQVILDEPASGVKFVEVEDRAAAEAGYKELEKASFDITSGVTLKPVVFSWPGNNHLFVLGYHRLVGDGSTTENLFVELAQLYSDTKLEPPPQFADFVARQRADFESGRMDPDIAYWERLYESVPDVLPVMPLPQAEPRAQHLSWKQHEAMARLDPMLASRVKERSRRYKATPMQLYLVAYHVLLARLTGTADVAIGIADTNRSSLDELSTMGFFANLLPIRMSFTPGKTFASMLVAGKDAMRDAMQHARVPYSVVLERLGLANVDTPSSHAPLFQAVFDYKQGQAESGQIGGAKITEVLASRERTPYDVTLEIWDDPTKEAPMVTVKLQDGIYGAGDPKAFLEKYVRILSMFSMNPALRVEEGEVR